MPRKQGQPLVSFPPLIQGTISSLTLHTFIFSQITSIPFLYGLLYLRFPSTLILPPILNISSLFPYQHVQTVSIYWDSFSFSMSSHVSYDRQIAKKRAVLFTDRNVGKKKCNHVLQKKKCIFFFYTFSTCQAKQWLSLYLFFGTTLIK